LEKKKGHATKGKERRKVPEGNPGSEPCVRSIVGIDLMGEKAKIKKFKGGAAKLLKRKLQEKSRIPHGGLAMDLLPKTKGEIGRHWGG